MLIVETASSPSSLARGRVGIYTGNRHPSQQDFPSGLSPPPLLSPFQVHMEPFHQALARDTRPTPDSALAPTGRRRWLCTAGMSA